MSDSSSWSLQIGRWRGVQIRVHAIFVAAAVLALYLSTSRPGQEAAGYGLMGIAVLLASVLIHELGHCFAAARGGGNPEQIVLGPLGGLAPLQLPREPQGELITALAGPVVNFGILLLVLPILIAARVDLLSLISPLQPTDLLEGAWWIVLLKLAFWMLAGVGDARRPVGYRPADLGWAVAVCGLDLLQRATRDGPIRGQRVGR
ncbi:MAG: hypothetical protein HY288_07280 [Planctomycetia bacterium]|nr:hypothetical protein [Planctomycetia bacterium]